MTRKKMKKLFMLILLVNFSNIVFADEPVENSKKNILFIAVDDLKPILGCYGDTKVITPNIDKLASQGTMFTNTHCQQAICAPSRVSILTGLRPDRTRVWDLKTLMRDENPDILTLPQLLKQNGYETVARGKVFDPRSVDSQKDGISWTVPYEQIPNSKLFMVSSEKVSTESVHFPDEEYNDSKIATQGIELLNNLSQGNKPFFLAVGFHKPHLPFVAPKKYWDLYKRNDFEIAPFQEYSEGGPKFSYQPGWELRNQYVDIPKQGVIPEAKQKELIHGYYACVSFIDTLVGRLIDRLDTLGIRENTIVVLWGDHGWHLGDHSMWCKHSNFEQSTRSPLIISSKDYSGNNINSSPTEFVDVFPTLCELSGIAIPENLDGKSLVPILKDPSIKVKEYAVSQYRRKIEGKELEGYTLRNDNYRLTVWMPQKVRNGAIYNESEIVATELYDYIKDSLETVNHYNKVGYEVIQKELLQYMREYFKSRIN